MQHWTNKFMLLAITVAFCLLVLICCSSLMQVARVLFVPCYCRGWHLGVLLWLTLDVTTARHCAMQRCFAVRRSLGSG